MKRIDIHTHIMPGKMPNWVQKFGYGEFIHLEHRNCQACMMKGDKVFREVEDNCFVASARLADMETTNVDIQVLSTIPVLFNYWAKAEDTLSTSQFFNDHIAQTVSDHPDRFIGLGTLPLQNTNLAIREMHRCLRDLGMPGVEIGTNVNQKNLGDPSLFEFYAEAERAGCALFIHPWDMMGEKDITEYWLPWLVGMPAETTRAICSMIFGGVLEKFPSLRIAFAHGGGSFPYTLGRIKHGFDVRPDLVQTNNTISPEKYLGRFWVDSLVHQAESLQFLRQAVGDQKVCMGSDYPFPLGEQRPGSLIDELHLDINTQTKFFETNALDWLGR